MLLMNISILDIVRAFTSWILSWFVNELIRVCKWYYMLSMYSDIYFAHAQHSIWLLNQLTLFTLLFVLIFMINLTCFMIEIIEIVTFFQSLICLFKLLNEIEYYACMLSKNIDSGQSGVLSKQEFQWAKSLFDL